MFVYVNEHAPFAIMFNTQFHSAADCSSDRATVIVQQCSSDRSTVIVHSDRATRCLYPSLVVIGSIKGMQHALTIKLQWCYHCL